MRFGVHVSISGGVAKALDRAKALGCETMQIFASNPRGWGRKDLDSGEAGAFRQRLIAEGKISPVLIHSPYLPNLGAANDEIYAKSKAALLDDVRRADALGAAYVVIHPGNYNGQEQDKGLARASQALAEVIGCFDTRVMILLENTAGGGSELGGSITQLGAIAQAVPGGRERIGMCLDTCHAFVAGYDLRTEKGWENLLDEVAAAFGLDRLKALHVNDAKGEMGQHLDHHTHIGEGQIGLAGFRLMVRQKALQGLPGILETPVNAPGDDLKNLAAVRNLWHEVER